MATTLARTFKNSSSGIYCASQQRIHGTQRGSLACYTCAWQRLCHQAVHNAPPPLTQASVYIMIPLDHARCTVHAALVCVCCTPAAPAPACQAAHGVNASRVLAHSHAPQGPMQQSDQQAVNTTSPANAPMSMSTSMSMSVSGGASISDGCMAEAAGGGLQQVPPGGHALHAQCSTPAWSHVHPQEDEATSMRRGTNDPILMVCIACIYVYCAAFRNGMLLCSIRVYLVLGWFES